MCWLTTAIVMEKRRREFIPCSSWLLLLLDCRVHVPRMPIGRHRQFPTKMPLFSCAQPPTAFPSIAALFRLWTDSSRLAVYSVWLVSVGVVLLRLPLARMGPPDPALGSRRASEKPFSFCLLCILVTVRAYILLGIGKNECFPFPRCLLDGFGLLCWDK